MPYFVRTTDMDDKGAANSRLESCVALGTALRLSLAVSSMVSACHLVRLVCLSRISLARDTFENKKGMRNTHFKPKASYSQMMSLIAAWRQGKEGKSSTGQYRFLVRLIW